MKQEKYPKIGVGVMIQNKKGQILLGLRKGSFAANQWAFPGGHLEFGETIFQCAQREVKEETGLSISKFKIISVSDDLSLLKSEKRQYLTIGIRAQYKGGKPIVCEPKKCFEWKWFSKNTIPKNIFGASVVILKNTKLNLLNKMSN